MNTTQQYFKQTPGRTSSNAKRSEVRSGYICLINDQSLILASGNDAASFLHNQLSNDVEHLSANQARYGGYCTPKGRMLASFLYWRHGDNILLQCSASLQPGVQKRLQMFIMRAKASLQDVTDEYAIIGLGGEQVQTFLRSLFDQLPEEINAKSDSAYGTLMRVHDAFEAARYQWVVSHEIFAQIQTEIPAAMQIVDASIWRLGDIHAGIPQVIEKTKEQFVPQMINFELIGGVNFKKGCYPGQEIVARSQYLGKLKRRMAIAAVDAEHIEAGMEIFSENDATQPCGMIVNAERDFDNNFACLIEIKLADQEENKVHLAKVDGTILKFLALPYAYLDITE